MNDLDLTVHQRLGQLGQLLVMAMEILDAAESETRRSKPSIQHIRTIIQRRQYIASRLKELSLEQPSEAVQPSSAPSLDAAEGISESLRDADRKPPSSSGPKVSPLSFGEGFEEHEQ